MKQYPEWLMNMGVVVMLPTLTCFGYYSVDYLDDKSLINTVLVMLSYPAILISIVGLFKSLRVKAVKKWLVFFWGIGIILPSGLLIWLRL